MGLKRGELMAVCLPDPAKSDGGLSNTAGHRGEEDDQDGRDDEEA